MTTSTSKPIVWERQQFYGADEIGFTESGAFVLSLYSYEPPHEKSGNYFTAIPISDKKYREKHTTKAAYRDEGDALIVYDDWGRPHRIEAERDLLDVLCDECTAQDLPELASHKAPNA